jgi:hypothetical protein
LVGHTHGAARDAELSRQIPPGSSLAPKASRPVWMARRIAWSICPASGVLPARSTSMGEGGHRALVQ